MFQALKVVLSDREFEEYVKVLRHLFADLASIPGLTDSVLEEMGFKSENRPILADAGIAL